MNATDQTGKGFAIPPLKFILVPVAAWIIFMLMHSVGGLWITLLAIPALIYCTLQAVHHAEIIAHRIGEPFGSLVLALAVTVIEVSLIVSMMFSNGAGNATLARDTVFAAVMIILTGMIGISLVAGSLKFREQQFGAQGINSVLTVLLAISVLALILPNYTESVQGAYFSHKQLIFVSLVSVVLYASFVFVQNFKHRDLFLVERKEHHGEEHALPTKREAIYSLILLLVCLGAVITLAESLAPDLEVLIEKIHAPHALEGIIIATIILLPEGLSAYRAAQRDQLQTTLNLALGSALASVCLTIPAVSVFSIAFNIPLALGLEPKSTVLLLLAFFVVMLSFRTGKTFILPGIVLLMIFASYVFMTIFP